MDPRLRHWFGLTLAEFLEMSPAAQQPFIDAMPTLPPVGAYFPWVRYESPED